MISQFISFQTHLSFFKNSNSYQFNNNTMLQLDHSNIQGTYYSHIMYKYISPWVEPGSCSGTVLEDREHQVDPKTEGLNIQDPIIDEEI